VLVDENGMIRLVNASAEKLFGYRREELVGRPVESLVPEHYLGLHLDDLTFHLVLTGGDLLDGLPQCCETLRHLLHLRRVEGGGGCFLRDGFRSSVFGTGQWLRPAKLLDPARDHLLGLR
jgi:PAS domain-containing protein